MNGLKFIRTRCNLSLSELADVIGVSRQQISAWENGVKSIAPNRLKQLSEYFGLEEKFFLEITEEEKAYVLSKGMYLRQDSEKEKYCYIKQGDMKVDFKWAPYYYPDDEISLDNRMILAKKKKQDTLENVDATIRYFNDNQTIMNQIMAINRGCLIFDLVNKYMGKMPNEEAGNKMVYYYIIRNTMLALSLANDLISETEVEKFFEGSKHEFLYDEREWVKQQAKMYRERYDAKKQYIKEDR